MLRKLYLLFVGLALSVGLAYGQAGSGSIKGSVLDSETGEPLPFVKIVLYQGGIIKGGTESDFDGKFEFSSVTSGEYDVEFRDQEYQPRKLEGVRVSAERITFLDKTTLTKPEDVQQLDEVQVTAYKVPLIQRDGGAQGATRTREEIANLPVRSASGVAATVGGVNESESSGGISVRGSREGSTYYYIDGIKVRGSANLPKSSLEEIQVITGGVPANYGDVTGGIISVTTRGPSSRYFGSIEGVSSGFKIPGSSSLGYDDNVVGLDRFGYNLVEGMIAGPLIRKKDSTGKKGEPIIGFLLSGTYKNEAVPRPMAGGTWRIKEDVREDLLQNPLRVSSDGKSFYDNANFLGRDAFENIPFSMNAARSEISASGKIDVNTGPTVNLTFGGSLNYGFGKNYNRYNSLMNFENFGNVDQLDWRVYGRFHQSFRNDNEESSSKVKSFYYNIMVDYSQSTFKSYDPHHEFSIFDYGHVGYFETSIEPTYEYDLDQNMLVHNGYRSTRVDFTPSDINPTLSAITSQYYELNSDPVGHFENLDQIAQNNGLRNGDSRQNVYSLWGGLGTPYTGFNKQMQEQLRITGSASLVVGGHNISLGFEYEQRWDRGWGANNQRGVNVDVTSIWTIARQYMNSHIGNLDGTMDFDSPYYDFYGGVPRVTYDRLNSGYAAESGTGKYGGDAEEDEQYFFDYNFREALGLDPAGNDWVDIDRYDPNVFSLDMFSPDEILNSGQNFITYYGYDHTGKKVSGVTDIDKYFTEFDENGNFKRFIGAYQPTYIAAYIMDKFSFDDIIFNVGLRVDVFDANQPVLKDPYLFMNARTAQEALSLRDQDPSEYNWVNVPENIGDDYTVYVNDINNPTAINGFRKGDNWYDNNGDAVEDPSILRGSAGIAPWVLNPDQKTPTSDEFENYKVSINLMPRISFSFPISDEANFFANYDVLTRRPTSNVRFDPIDYHFITARSNPRISNSNLRPEKTIDYSFGFQQVVTRTSSIKFNAFYREQRDMIRVRKMLEAYPTTYESYANRDFATIKGFTLEYDLRRTGNIRLNASYTLQFADGTGSNPDDDLALTLANSNQPDLRTISPLDFDQRHAFSISFDYRYGAGKDYNGPSIGETKLFENMGLNVIALIKSGTPYTSEKNITSHTGFGTTGDGSPHMTGTLNGSRLPWNYTLDLVLDRTWALEFGKKDDKKKHGYLNVYLRVTNLLNQFNVLNVYRATGVPDDDGFLAAAEWQNTIQNKLDEQSYRDYYDLMMVNPYNISRPRTIRIGVKFDF